MRILAIDPGTTKSAYVIYEKGVIVEFGIKLNQELLQKIVFDKSELCTCEHLAIEMIASYGMAVGQEVFETCVWIGRFVQAWTSPITMIYRKDVKIHLCNSMRAKDGNIRQAIIDRYPATGGGKIPQIGIKKQPGPLYGVSKDIWAALGVAITYAETN